MNDPVALHRRMLVLGATSQVGFFLMPILARRGIEVKALTRRPDRAGDSSHPGVGWRTYSPEALAASLVDAGRFDAAICLAPLPELLPMLFDLARLGVRRVVAFGTTSRFSKHASADLAEQHHMRRFITAEAELPAKCDALGISWTLFRPTLVYGCGRDANIAFIASCIRRFGFFPLAEGGRGLRQPVHAADLAQACADALDNSRTHAKAYNLSGGSTLTYRQMVEAVFRQLGRPIMTPHVPTTLFRAAIAVTKRLPRLHGLSTEMATRMGTDLCFDHLEATRDFGFDPRPFGLDNLAVDGGGQ
jgi:nucleoside-diphosphate-sugar epimerase